MHIAEVLASIRKSSLSEAEKGTKFEHLIRAWFLADPVYADLLSDVWLWRNFPAEQQFGGHDLGIDFVARTKLGEYWAIQCKFYGENMAIGKVAVDSFIANSSRTFTAPFTGGETSFSARYWVSTNDCLRKIARTFPIRKDALSGNVWVCVDVHKNGHPGSQLAKDHAYCYSHPTNAGLATHNFRISCYPIQRFHSQFLSRFILTLL